MLPGDPQLEQALRGEIRKSGRRRRYLFIAVTVVIVAFLAWAVLAAVTAPDASAQSPEPPPYPEGTGVTFEPIGPSMWRVIEPEPDCEYLPSFSYPSVEIASDGRAWIFDRLRGIRELGACPVLGPSGSFGIRAQALALDGTVWVLERDRLMSWKGEEWVLHAEGEFNVMECDALGDGPDTPEGVDEYGGQCSTRCEEQACYFGLDVAPDGTVWLSGDTVSAYDRTAWTHYPEAQFVLGFGPEGVVWAEGYNQGLLVIRP